MSNMASPLVLSRNPSWSSSSHSKNEIAVVEQSKELQTTNLVESVTSNHKVLWKRFLTGDANEVHDVQRKLNSRHIMMIAIGGTIGTGIFLSAGSSVAIAGPGSALISYAIIGFFCYAVVISLGEMASYIPVSGTFAVFATRFVSPAMGFTLGWNYWLQWSLSIPSELISAAIILQYWTLKLQAWEWALVIIVPIFTMQLIHVRIYGESEYWFALIKVIMVIVFIIVGLIYDWGGVKGHPGPGLSNFRHGQAFVGGFTGFAQTFVWAFYSYGGVELVSLAAGESARPHITLPRAIRATFFRVVLFYVLTILTIGLCINFQDETLLNAAYNSDVAASPITTVFKRAGYKLLLLRQLSRGVPIPALLMSLAVSFLSFLTTIWGEGVVFTWFLNIVGISALLVWGSIGLISLRFRQAWNAQGRNLRDLPYTQPLFPLLPVTTVVLAVLMFIGEGYAAAMSDPFDWRNIVATYIGVAFYALLFIGFIIYQRYFLREPRIFIPILEVDLDTDAVWKQGEGDIIRQRDRELKEKKELEEGAMHGLRHWIRRLRKVSKHVY
ncbi:hypothetical protein ABKN59_001626 [Abortiporus biennis]